MAPEARGEQFQYLVLAIVVLVVIGVGLMLYESIPLVREIQSWMGGPVPR